LSEIKTNVGLLGVSAFDDSCYQVKQARVTECYSKWCDELHGDVFEEYILDGIKNGFNIVDSSDLPVDIFSRNYKSVLSNKLQAECRLIEQINEGNYVMTHEKPLVVSALGAVPKDEGDIRIIHDLSRPDGGVNRLAWDTSVAFTSVDEATKLISESSFLAKIDLKSAYRSIPVSKSCFQLTGLHWKFGPDQKTFFFMILGFRLVLRKVVSSFRLSQILFVV
jgi:hypothetical protein